MENDLIIQAVKSFKPLNNGSSLPILKNGCVRDGWLCLTNLNHYVRVQTEYQTNTIVNSAMLLKTKDIALSVDSSIEEKEFPIAGSGECLNGGDVPSSIFTEDLRECVNYAATDDCRAVLMGVFFDMKRKNAVATDGHRMINKKIHFECENGTPDSFIVPSVGIKLILDFAKAGQGVGHCFLYYPKTEDAKTKEIGHAADPKYLIVCGARYWLQIRLIEGRYPDYWKVLPKKGTSVPVTDVEVASLKAAIDVLLPAANVKTAMLCFRDNEGFVGNPDVGKYWKINLGFRFTPEVTKIIPEDKEAGTPETTETKILTIGFNGVYLRELLGYSQGVTKIQFNSDISAVLVFTKDKTIRLIMPLRIMNEKEGDTKDLDAEGWTDVAFTVPEPKAPKAPKSKATPKPPKKEKVVPTEPQDTVKPEKKAKEKHSSEGLVKVRMVQGQFQGIEDTWTKFVSAAEKLGGIVSPEKYDVVAIVRFVPKKESA
jgi:DNA polymerase III sliding clamp (beta) subunit (PCNA family)